MKWTYLILACAILVAARKLQLGCDLRIAYNADKPDDEPVAQNNIGFQIVTTEELE